MMSSKSLVSIVAFLALTAGWANDGLAEAKDGQQVVYENDFEKAVGPEWSRQATEITPKKERRFLGQFCNDTVQLTLEDLPAHSEITVSFDLLVIRKWDGNYTQYGPDFWDLSVTNGPMLLRTTFSNGKNYQSYPDVNTDGNNPPHTRAEEINTLGYEWRGKPTDSVYKLSFTFAHTDNRLQLNFSASGLERLVNESWGLDNARVCIGEQAASGPPSTFERRVPGYIPREGLVALWLADGNGYDSAGKNHGTAQNGAAYGPGKFGKAFKLDGKDDYFTMNDVLDWGNGSWTVALWFKKVSDSTGQMKIFNKGQTGYGQPKEAGYELRILESRAEFSVVDASLKTFRTQTDEPSANEWHHLVGVLDHENSEIRLYLDSRLADTKSIIGLGKLDTNIPLALGALDRGGFGPVGEFFEGLIDEVGVWNRALSSEEISGLCDLPKDRFEGIWSGIAVDKKEEGSSKDPLTIGLSMTDSGELLGHAAGRFVAPGFEELHDVQISGNELSFVVIHRIGMRMKVTLTLTGQELRGEGIPIDIDEDSCDIVLERVHKKPEKPSQSEEKIERDADFDRFVEGLEVISAGHYAGNMARISLNKEVLFSGGKRGITLLALEGDKVHEPVSFDTHGDQNAANRFADAVASLPRGCMVVLVVQDEATRHFNQRGQQAILSIGGKVGLLGQPRRRSYYCIGRKGLEAGQAIEKVAQRKLCFPAEEPKDNAIQLRFDSAEVLKEFISRTTRAWQVENGELIGWGVGKNEKPFLTYKKYFKEISKVVIKGSVLPVDTEAREVHLRKRVLKRTPQGSTNFRVSVGRINLIFNQEVGNQNQYSNDQVRTVQKGHALTPGKTHTIVIEQVGKGVFVSVDNKQVYVTEAILDGTVTVYPAHGSKIKISGIDITGVSDPQRAVRGHSHTNTF